MGTFPEIGNDGDCMGDALRGQGKDVTKFAIAKNADDTLTFRSDGWPDLKLSAASLKASALSGKYHGSVPFILDMDLNFLGDSTMDFDQNVKVASTEIKCPAYKIAETDAEVTFPEIGNDGDCMGDALRGQGKDVTKFAIAKNADDTLTFRSDGWPDLKLGAAALKTSALSGKYHGSVPFILDMDLNFPGDGTLDFDQNVKVASVEINCPGETIAETDDEISFPDIVNDGDCMGDALRGQDKDVTKFTIAKNADD